MQLQLNFNLTYKYRSTFKLVRNTDEYAKFHLSVVIMRPIPFKKYQTCELKSKITDRRRYSVKICAFYRASATTLFFLNFEKI